MKKSGLPVSSLRLSNAIIAALCGSAAFAQSGSQVDSPSGALEEVVVTALKRDTRLLDTPAAISAVGPEMLRDQQITSLADLSTKIPSLQTNQQSGIDYVSIRGITINSTTGAIENPVAIHVDGAYLAQTTSLDFLMLDLASVEVLRGPQGTLYGRNSTGGAINFVTAKPTDTAEGLVSASYGNYETARVTAVLSGPLSSTLSGRIAVLGARQGEGFIENETTGNTIGEMEAAGVRGALRWAPSDETTLDLSMFAYYEDNDGNANIRKNPFNAVALTRNPILATSRENLGKRRVFLDYEPHGQRAAQGAILTGQFEFSPSVSLKTITSYTDVGTVVLDVDTDGSEISLGAYNRREDTYSAQQEIDLNFSLLDERFTGLVGVFYDRERWNLDARLPWLDNPQGFVSVGPVLPVNSATVSDFRQRTTSKAIFTDFNYQLTDRFSLFGGYRVSQDKRELTLTTGLAGLPGEVGLTCRGQSFEAKFDSETGKVGAKYAFGSGSVYLQFQQGFKAGGLQPFGCPDPYEPEELDSWEAGYKTSLLNGKLVVNLAAFHYDYTNLQVTQIVNNTSRTDNAAAATVKGVELDGVWRVASMLRADVAVSYLDATFDEYSDMDSLNPQLGFQDLSGRRLIRAPEISGTAGLEAELAFAPGTFTLRGEVFHSARQYFRPYEEKADSQDPYSLVNLYAVFKPAAAPGLTVRAYVKNATDRDYIVGLFSANLFADRWVSWGAPRTFGLATEYRF
jgi:iron complex outermembrane receptor protein